MDTINNLLGRVMTETKIEFFELLRSGLWGSSIDSKLFTKNTDWLLIYDLSKKQAVLGNVLDGINMLPPNLRPPRLLYIKWCAEVIQIEDENHKLNKEIIKLFKLLIDNGISPILMKGQGIASNYKNPFHRISGDIDVFTGKQNYDKANKLLSLEGKVLEKWSPIHLMFNWHGVSVENHRLLAKMASPINNLKLNKLIEEWFIPERLSDIEIEDYKITVPPIDFDVVFILLHAVIHLMGYGVGLRQIIDWTLLLYNKKDQIDSEVVKSLLKKLGLIKAARIFGVLAVKYIGLPKEYLIIPYSYSDEKLAEKLLDDIWHNGNFGFSGTRKRKLPKSWLLSRLFNFYYKSKRSLGLLQIVPGEAIWKPSRQILNFIDLRLDKYGRKNL